MVAAPVFAAVAIKLAAVPAQKVVPGPVAIVTDGLSDEVIFIVSELDRALVELRQFTTPLKEMIQVTTSPFASVEVVYVFELLF